MLIVHSLSFIFSLELEVTLALVRGPLPYQTCLTLQGQRLTASEVQVMVEVVKSTTVCVEVCAVRGLHRHVCSTVRIRTAIPCTGDSLLADYVPTYCTLSFMQLQ